MERDELILDLLNTLIDDRINMYGYRETIDYLLDYGLTEDILINELQFDIDDIAEAVKEYEDKNN